MAYSEILGTTLLMSTDVREYLGQGIGAAIGLAVLVSGLIMGALWMQHNTIKRQRGARYYVVPGSSRITNADDILVDTYVTSVKVSNSSDRD